MANTEIPDSFLDALAPHLPYTEGAKPTATDDLAALGLDSMGLVQLLADLEERYEVELSDELLTGDTFSTVGSLWSAVSDLIAPRVSVDD